jgi:nicotinamide-nucleotide amidase
MEITAELLTIGDEILYGQITDTNSQWLSEQLTSVGIKVIRRTSVGDTKHDILTALEDAYQRASLILITGGLGPTRDDITKHCLCEYFNTTLQLHEEALKELTAFFEKRGRTLGDTNRTQALLPEACTRIRNEHGTASGMLFQKEGKIFVSMPGVPFEMKNMFTNHVLPQIKQHFALPFIQHRHIRTSGIGESVMSDQLTEWEKGLPDHLKLAYLPTTGEVKLRLTGKGEDLNSLNKDLDQQKALLMNIIGEHVYAEEDITQEEAIGKLLRAKNLFLSVAESCTGGHIAHRITSVAGSSGYFIGGVVAYDNKVKISQLGVKPETLAQFGAVSEETVKEMAEGIRTKFGTEIALASTGIAGPDGGTPVGTIWIACATPNGIITKKLQLGTLRDINIRFTTTLAFDLLLRTLKREGLA